MNFSAVHRRRQQTITLAAPRVADGLTSAIWAPSSITLVRYRIRRSINPSKLESMPQAVIYTILIDDKPIVAIAARGSEARELCKEEWFSDELSGLKLNGEPLYRPGMRLRARPSTEEEWVRYDIACSEAVDAEDILFV
jgi:hypothetical protein